MRRLALLAAGVAIGWLGAEFRYGHHLAEPERLPEGPPPETPEERARRERGFVSQAAVPPEARMRGPETFPEVDDGDHHA